MIFRIFLLAFFLLAALKWGDWKNWQKYYPTVLFVMVQNLAAAFFAYHHTLWQYNQDILVKSYTTVEILNAFVLLPAVTITFLSKLPFHKSTVCQYGYIAWWVVIFGSLEFIAHYIVGSLSYGNGWSWKASILFDVGMFSIIRMHYIRPLLAWVMNLLMISAIIILLDFSTGQFK
ncbi:CBO0543 family protein [Sporomusa aerivorans]|uniref:CBO0543 family protein n=1 Tax=Sporomusa aerivorans TaxID=204936 RepID=UPI00352A40E5